jgi:chromosome segregation ATPase
MEISWGIPDKEPGDGSAPRSAPAEGTPELRMLEQENEVLRDQIRALEAEVHEWQTRAALHEMRLHEVKAEKLEQKNELDAAIEEIRRLKAELKSLEGRSS